MKQLLPGAPWLFVMARVFDDADAPLYLVGGAVRNPLMGLPLSDVDVCGPTLPREVCALCEGTPVRAVLRAEALGSVELYVEDEHGLHMAEYTTWREERYSGGHRPDEVRFTRDIAADARRRDFSVNALYRRVHADGMEEIIDPTGGLAHLAKGALHTVTEDPDLVLQNDGLRILRAARFQAELGLAPTAETMSSLCRHAYLLGEIAPERQREEWQKLLLADGRYPQIERNVPATYSGLSTLHQIGAWPLAMGEAPFDEAAARALALFPQAPLAARLALLLRRASPEQVSALLLRMRFAKAEAAQASRYAAALQQPELAHAARLGLDALAFAKDAHAALGEQAEAQVLENLLHLLEGKPLFLRDLAVNGEDLKPAFLERGLPLREMGRVLEGLWLCVLRGECANEKASLLQLFRSMV